jgi:hypothetical protein
VCCRREQEKGMVDEGATTQAVMDITWVETATIWDVMDTMQDVMVTILEEMVITKVLIPLCLRR